MQKSLFIFVSFFIFFLAGCLGFRHTSLKPGDDLLKQGLEYLEKKELDNAQASFKKALEEYQYAATGYYDYTVEGWCYYGLGTVAMQRAEYDQALSDFQTALASFKNELHPIFRTNLGKGWVYLNMGRIYKARNNLESAKTNLDSALLYLDKTGNEKDYNAFFLAYMELGYIQLYTGDYTAAEENLLAAEAGYKNTNPLEPVYLAGIYYYRGLISINKKNWGEAVKYLLQASGIYEQQVNTDKKTFGDLYYYLGAVYLEQKDMVQAEKYLKLALANYSQAIALYKSAGKEEIVKQMEEQVQKINSVF